MKNSDININWKLLAKFFSGETSESENEKIVKWVELSNENKQLFEKVQNDLKIIDSFDQDKQDENVNSNLAWDKFYQRLKQEDLINDASRNFKVNFAKYLRIAAIIVLAIGLSFITYKISSIQKNKLVISSMENEYDKEIILADGSVVYLNADSEISYPKKSLDDNRIVFLNQGEAFFKVSHDKNKPFFVVTKQAEIKVLGTSFNVSLRSGNKEIEVFVETGKVQLNKKNNIEKKVLIAPGFIGSISGNDLNKEVNKDNNYMAWKTRHLVFKEQNLESIIKTINRVYNSNVSLDKDEFANYKSTVTFDNQSLDAVLEALCAPFHLKADKRNTSIVLIQKED